LSSKKHLKTSLVSEVADALRELILAKPPGEQIGSLTEVVAELGVGIVTVQQAARILEHEGLLTVRRGPGGGYYGARPDDAAIERAFATYMRIHDIGYREAFELAVLLDCEIIQTAARSLRGVRSAPMAALIEQLTNCQTAYACIQFEADFRETLLRLFERPLLELLARVAMQLYKTQSDPEIFVSVGALEDWKRGRLAILQAIAQGDEELASFEANRFRQMVARWMQGQLRAAAPDIGSAGHG
jgi:GntR family transcriptional repressor for pyruvate dehydrogenase complex